MRQGEKIHPLQFREAQLLGTFKQRKRRIKTLGNSLFVLRDAVVLLGVLSVADQLGEALIMGDDNELEVLLRLPVLHDPAK
jgi:hypothetical protein